MGYSNGIITAPVSIYDVQQALSTSENREGGLCTHANINMWAKYKPVILNQINTTDEWDFTNNRWKDNASWFQGRTGVCGITPYETTNFANIISQTNNNSNDSNNGWVYNKPTGGASSPYRLMDFAGYNHNALPAVSNFAGSDNLSAGGRFSAQCLIPAVAGSDNVTLDIFSAHMYFGAAIVNSNNNVVYWGTNSSYGTYEVGFYLPAGFASGTYKVYPFLCEVYIEPAAPDQTTRKFYTVPNCTYFTLKVDVDTKPANKFTILARWTDAPLCTKVSMTVENTTSSLYSGGIYILRNGRDYTDSPFYQDEPNTPNMSFAPNTTTDPIEFTGLDSARNGKYHGQLVLDNNQGVAEILIMHDVMPI